MQKDLPPKLDSETLKQLATEQLVEIIIEQGKTIEKLTSSLIELEQEVEKLKFSRDLDSTTSSKPPSGDLLKKTENEFGLLPTPKAQDGIHPGVSTHKAGQTLHLSAAVMMPTPTKGSTNQGYELGSTKYRSLNPLFVSAMMGFPSNWTDISCDSQTLIPGLLLPQSPASIGSVVMKLQRLRQIARRNIANCMHNTKASEDNIKSS